MKNIRFVSQSSTFNRSFVHSCSLIFFFLSCDLTVNNSIVSIQGTATCIYIWMWKTICTLHYAILETCTMNIPCFALSIKAIHMKVLRIIHFNNEDYDFILEHFNKSLKNLLSAYLILMRIFQISLIMLHLIYYLSKICFPGYKCILK